ncbi:MAG TPA: DUF885 domain-containing protein [Jiangellales bacterium]|nr:DUF885 domain-containing protein [Jiangellales bacterium]
MTDTAPTTRTVTSLADAYVEEYAALDPYTATYAGIPGHDHETTDLSPEGFEARAELDRRTLADLAAVEPADEREHVARDAMVERLTRGLALHDLGMDRGLNVLDSPLHWTRLVFDLMPTGTEEHWAAVAARLAALPGALDAYRRTLEADTAAGLPPARRQVLAVAEQARRVAGGFFADLVATATVGGALQAGLGAAAEAASHAYADVAAYLADDLAVRARSRDAAGRDAYAIASGFFLGADVDLDETYEWGLAELDRIETEMAEVAGSIAPGGSVDDAVAALDDDPARRIEGADAFRGWMQELSDRTVEALAGVHFDIPAEIRRLECRIAPTRDGGIYYTGPSEDLSRPGRMWWSVPEGVESFSTWRETTTVFHEGVPGHHLQVANVVLRKDLLNRWQRLLCWVSGHGEGWALYAERLMADLGHLDDPGDRLGMLDGQAFRAARVVVDIGLHLEKPMPRGRGLDEGPWAPEAAYTFLRAHCRMPDEFLRFELDRYLGWPGQAPSYKVGERIWLQAREDARHRLGHAFDLRSFHTAALNLGSLGLDPLREALARL